MRRAPEPGPASVADRRRQPRQPAAGQVIIVVSDHSRRRVQGRLVDCSEDGFRVAHQCAGLESGCLVEFRHPEGSGRAKLIWNRLVRGECQSGFLVLWKEPPDLAGPDVVPSV